MVYRIITNISLPFVILVIVSVIEAVEKNTSYATVNYPIRAIYTCPQDNGDSLSVNLLKRAKKNSYTHVLSEYFIQHKDEWENGVYRYSYSGKLFWQLKNDFQTAAKEGLRLIPLFQTGSCHSGHWRNTNNDRIQWELLANGKDSDMPAMAPDSEGFEKSFKELLRVIFEAHKEADPGYPLDYIHLGHDEAIVSGKKKVHLLIGTSSSDKKWIKENRGTSIHHLMVEELRNRIQNVRSIDGLSGTRVMIWGDMWDAQQNGGSKAVATAGALRIAAKDSLIVQNVVFLPWQYTKEYDGHDYDTHRAYSNFTNNGFSIVMTGCTANGDKRNELVIYLPQLVESMVTARLPEFKPFLLGYAAVHWDNLHYSKNPGYDRYPDKACYLAIEMMAEMNLQN